ncbi:histone H1-like repetitive region-containing protein [Desulfosarcina alkanivorans]|uniref:histone H1-like repetitive region-containing protein n=1 Tax=Desulfosarcina alkanivorans TaxID=571177 RepID=UPI0018D904E1|nr:histone H1-like repetitive region-containing protein [Desulfosarcina alkanivorans]
MKKKFDIVTPTVLYTVPAKMVAKSTFTAPERLAGFNADDTQRIKGLLANVYSEKDLKAAAEKAAAEKAAAEKAAAEKAAAEKAAAEKAAAEKAAAEKAAAEKAAAEKAAAEKAAAEKAAAEKAAAEKAAAEKAAAEKAAAEKAAAEKAAAEKAAAEKAAAEKAAAEKAAAEKAAAEKAAAEKAEAIKNAAAQKSDVSVSYETAKAPAKAQKPSDPVDNSIKLLAAGLAFLILLVVGASASNSFKYYLAENQGALEVWKGKFAPLGKKMLIALPGVPAPEDLKGTYRSDDVYPLVFAYYIDKADALLDVPGIPDFEGIKATLKTALEYGSTSALRDAAYVRLDNIDRLILTYKADVAASRGTIEDLTAAIGFLKDADKLTTDKAQEEINAQKIAAHLATITMLEEQAAAAEAEAEQAAADAEAEAEAARQAEAGAPASEDAIEAPEAAPDHQ